jgi:hypothetical protein
VRLETGDSNHEGFLAYVADRLSAVKWHNWKMHFIWQVNMYDLPVTLPEPKVIIDVAYYDPLLEVGIDGPPSAQAPLSNPLNPGFGEAQQSGGEASLKGGGWLTCLLSNFKRKLPWTIAISVGMCVLIVLGVAYTRTRNPTEQHTTRELEVRGPWIASSYGGEQPDKWRRGLLLSQDTPGSEYHKPY